MKLLAYLTIGLAMLACALPVRAGTESALHVVYAKARIVEAADADDDGLADFTESQIGTDPGVADSDGDGLMDGDEEIVVGTSALIADCDGDGFGDGLEVAAGADPLSPDSFPVTISGTIIDETPFSVPVMALVSLQDAPRFDDLIACNSATSLVCRTFVADEAPAGFSFANAVAAGVGFRIDAWADITDDGIQDAWEPAAFFVTNGVESAELSGVELVLAWDEDVDSDGNGLPDIWEWRNLGAIGNSPSDDLDGDGLDNAAEFQWGTDPLNDDSDYDGMADGDEVFVGFNPLVPDPLPQLSLQRTANGMYRLEWDTRYYQGYMPQYSDTLAPPAWSNLVPHALYEYQAYPYGTMSIIDIHTNSPARFYRIKLVK